LAVLRIERCGLPEAMESLRTEWQIRFPERHRSCVLYSVFQTGSSGERSAARFPAEESPRSYGSESRANEVHNDAVYKDSAAGHALHCQSGQ